jgi:hypothetical protein
MLPAFDHGGGSIITLSSPTRTEMVTVPEAIEAGNVDDKAGEDRGHAMQDLRRSYFSPAKQPVSSLKWLHCPQGHAQLVVGVPSLLEPTRLTTRRAFPWLPPFP